MPNDVNIDNDINIDDDDDDDNKPIITTATMATMMIITTTRFTRLGMPGSTLVCTNWQKADSTLRFVFSSKLSWPSWPVTILAILTLQPPWGPTYILSPQLAQQLSIMTYLLNLALVFRLLLRTELVIVFILSSSLCYHVVGAFL